MSSQLVQIGDLPGKGLPRPSTDGKTFYLETFGCQMNAHDSEKVAGLLVGRGYRRVSSYEEADLVFYNTCSIREKAAQKVFSRLGILKEDPGLKEKFIGVLGCVAQQEGEKIFQRAPHVNLVCGSASYHRLPEMLSEMEAGKKRVTGLSLDTDECFETEITRRDQPFRAYLTIIEGCDKSCAYCVVPMTRGPERSRPSDKVLEDCHRLVNEGYTEIQLLGQNVNSYRDPSPAGWSFAELLARVGEVDGLRRARFTTSHPRDFHPEIVEAIATHPVLCDHVHLPVQSGSDRVLSRMRRDYTREEYLEKINCIRNAGRAISISTDLIVGFPGETREDFEQTLTLVDEVGYDSAFSFKYSPRPKTSAFLEFLCHVDVNHLHRDMAGAFDHRLHVMLPRNLCQFTERAQFRKLRFVVCVRDRPGAQAVAETERNVVRFHDLADFFEARVEEIFLVMRETPLG